MILSHYEDERKPKTQSKQHSLAINSKAKQEQIHKRIQLSNFITVRMQNSRQHSTGLGFWVLLILSQAMLDFIQEATVTSNNHIHVPFSKFPKLHNLSNKTSLSFIVNF